MTGEDQQVLLDRARKSAYEMRVRAVSFIDVGRNAARDSHARTSSRFGRRAKELNEAADLIDALLAALSAVPASPSLVHAGDPPVIAGVAPACQWCDQGVSLLLLDRNGDDARPPVGVFHWRDDHWWPCERFALVHVAASPSCQEQE